MQRWAVILQAYNYQVEYPSSAEHANADALSRLPCDISPMKEEAEMFIFSGLDELPVALRTSACTHGEILCLVRVF